MGVSVCVCIWPLIHAFTVPSQPQRLFLLFITAAAVEVRRKRKKRIDCSQPSFFLWSPELAMYLLHITKIAFFLSPPLRRNLPLTMEHNHRNDDHSTSTESQTKKENLNVFSRNADWRTFPSWNSAALAKLSPLWGSFRTDSLYADINVDTLKRWTYPRTHKMAYILD